MPETPDTLPGQAVGDVFPPFRPMGPDEEWADQVPRSWDTLTALERRVERWRQAHGLTHWCPDGPQSPTIGQAEAPPAPTEEPTPEPAAPTDDQADDGPTHRPCPRCFAKPGEKCRNYRGVNCAPHRDR